MKTNTATMAMIIAMVAMIGMTGLAMAGSSMDYEIDFSSVGTGSVNIGTVTPVGIDIQQSSWSNCDVNGYQDGTYGGSTWTKIDRGTTITGLQNYAPASGQILTQSMPTTPVSDPTKLARVTTLATYYDNAAYGSYVTLGQNAQLSDSDVPVVDDNGDEKATVYTEITGYAYGNAATMVNGSVVSLTDGSLTAATSIAASVHDGNLDMDVWSRITDDTVDDETSKTCYLVGITSPHDTADGYIAGHAAVNGVTVDSMNVVYVNADVTATGYFYAVTV